MRAVILTKDDIQ